MGICAGLCQVPKDAPGDYLVDVSLDTGPLAGVMHDACPLVVE